MIWVTGLTLISIREKTPRIGFDLLAGVKDDEVRISELRSLTSFLTNNSSEGDHRRFPYRPPTGREARLAISPCGKAGVIARYYLV
jgi:hypothetical protein